MGLLEAPPPTYEDAIDSNRANVDKGQDPVESQQSLSQPNQLTTLQENNFLSRSTSKPFFISQRGISCSLVSKELQTSISTSLDGSSSYWSTRSSRSSGSCVLSHEELGDLISTKYRFGPGRPPELFYLKAQNDQEPITIHSTKWYSRGVKFTALNGRTFEWNYAREKSTKSNLLVLTESNTASGKGGEDALPLATLIRNDQTRPSGSSKWSAGNGGELFIDAHAGKIIDEALVIATCLVMLKKEIDRKRSSTVATVAAVSA